MEDYLVPRGVGRAEYIEKKSRFLGGVYPVTSEQEAKRFWSACANSTMTRGTTAGATF